MAYINTIVINAQQLNSEPWIGLWNLLLWNLYNASNQCFFNWLGFSVVISLTITNSKPKWCKSDWLVDYMSKTHFPKTNGISRIQYSKSWSLLIDFWLLLTKTQIMLSYNSLTVSDKCWLPIWTFVFCIFT